MRASSNGLTMVVSITDFTGSTMAPNILAAESLDGCACGGCGVLMPEGMADAAADSDGDGDADGDGACSCQYMGSSSCSNSSASKPCCLRAVAARAPAKNSALALKGCPADGFEGLCSLDNCWARGSSEAGTDTKAPKSESVELAVLIEPTRGRELLEGRSKMDEDPNGVGEAGGVAGEKSVAKRSSRSGLVGGGRGARLPAGRGIKGEKDSSGEGIPRV